MAINCFSPYFLTYFLLNFLGQEIPGPSKKIFLMRVSRTDLNFMAGLKTTACDISPTSMGNKGLSIMLTHLGLNPDWSILDNSISSVTCAMRVCSTTRTVASQRLNAAYKRKQKKDKQKNWHVSQ